MKLGVWIALGVGIGTAIGAAINQTAMGVALGAASGTALGTAFSVKRRLEPQDTLDGSRARNCAAVERLTKKRPAGRP